MAKVPVPSGRFALGAFAVAGLASVVAMTGAGPSGKVVPKAKAPADPFAVKVVPAVTKFCAPCHGAEPIAGANLTKAKTGAQALTQRDVWAKVLDNVKSGHMPPKGGKQPTPAERAAMVAALESTLSGDCNLADAGRVTVRRLNREEYDNTIRDLTGLDLRIAHDTFPSDDVGYGFDNIGDVLSTSPLLTEKLLDAAEKISEAAIVIPGKKVRHFAGGEMPDVPGVGGDGEKVFYSSGETGIEVDLPKAGYYTVRVMARASLAGPELPKLRVAVGETAETFQIGSDKAAPFEFKFKRGESTKTNVKVSFLNDFYDANAPDGRKDRNVYVSHVQIIGPLGDDAKPDSHRRIVPVDPAPGKEVDTAKSALAAFATKAWRRPVKPDEVERLMKVYEFGARPTKSFESGIRLGVQAILVSPHFLFRIETDPGGKARPLTGYELASRMSYFVWASTPDARLMNLAKSGEILKPAVQEAEVTRMLKDPRAKALADNFAMQWLQLRKLQTFAPDPDRFPTWNEGLRKSMLGETLAFFGDVVRNDRPVTAFLDGKFTYVDKNLATLYGIPGDFGSELRKIQLPADGPRAGLLTQGAVLTVTSNPTRTSPVKRGKWVLEALLGTPPPPPPPNVGDLGDDKKILTAASLRQRLEEHRKNAVCASCHKRMDPIGFGMENFDPIGRWRTGTKAEPIDTAGVLPDGKRFSGPVELRKILVGKSDRFVAALSEQMLTYALGRGVSSADKCHVDTIVKETRAEGDRFSALVAAVVKSDPFRKRGAAKAPGKVALK